MDQIVIKWSGNDYKIENIFQFNTVLDLKNEIKTLTGVLPERQKLLGLKIKGNLYFRPRLLKFSMFFFQLSSLCEWSVDSGKAAGDEVKLVDLHIKPNTKIMMMGSKEEDVVSGKSLSLPNNLFDSCQRV